MSASYTYWTGESGMIVGYWNDYPNFVTEGRDLADFRRMLCSLRDDINEMTADGTLTEVPRNVATMEFA